MTSSVRGKHSCEVEAGVEQFKRDELLLAPLKGDKRGVVVDASTKKAFRRVSLQRSMLKECVEIDAGWGVGLGLQDSSYAFLENKLDLTTPAERIQLWRERLKIADTASKPPERTNLQECCWDLFGGMDCQSPLRPYIERYVLHVAHHAKKDLLRLGHVMELLQEECASSSSSGPVSSWAFFGYAESQPRPLHALLAVNNTGLNRGRIVFNRFDQGFCTMHQFLQNFLNGIGGAHVALKPLRLNVFKVVGSVDGVSLGMEDSGLEFLFHEVRSLTLRPDFVPVPEKAKKTVALPRGLFVRRKRRNALKAAMKVERGARGARGKPGRRRGENAPIPIIAEDGSSSERSRERSEDGSTGSSSRSSSSSSTSSSSSSSSSSSKSSSSTSSPSSTSAPAPAPVPVPVPVPVRPLRASTYFEQNIGVCFPGIDKAARKGTCKQCGNEYKRGQVRIMWSWHPRRPQCYVHPRCLGRIISLRDNPGQLASEAIGNLRLHGPLSLDVEMTQVRDDLIVELRQRFLS
jgi:hypothetical protein